MTSALRKPSCVVLQIRNSCVAIIYEDWRPFEILFNFIRKSGDTVAAAVLLYPFTRLSGRFQGRSFGHYITVQRWNIELQRLSFDKHSSLFREVCSMLR